MKITLVTGNPGKLAEWKRLVPADYELLSRDIDLEEIQSIDMEEIIVDKVRRAYSEVKSPVIVEDVAAGLDRLGGLPGPFIKFFEKAIGRDALFQLAQSNNEAATVRCAVAYYDGTRLVTAHSEVPGVVVPARGENGFGFDACFVPAGQPKTYGEMTAAEKDLISHRSKAIALLVNKLPAAL
jgi:non-canonical purine NTP pyrophosphatase (RdgB/HAM1 family)